MPIAIDPQELSIRVEAARKAFDPEVHGRHDLPAMPKYPIDGWFDSSERGPDLSELVRIDGHFSEPAMLYASVAERLMETLNPAEKKPYLDALRYMNGQAPESGNKLNDFWTPEEVGSIFIWFAYSPVTCGKAAEAIESSRFIDLFQTAFERKFSAWNTGEEVFSVDDFWRIVRGDLEFSYGIHSIHKLEQSFIRYLRYCEKNDKAFVHEHWDI